VRRDTATQLVGPSETGTVTGSVVDVDTGEPQAIGRIYLLAKSGLNSGIFADVTAAGTYDFGTVPVGEHQLRFWGANLANVPYPAPNPVRITVAANTPVVVQFAIDAQVEEEPDHDVYIGDFFFQDQPNGTPNGTIVAKLGTTVCWYNVGTMVHSVTGGPWGDSGPIALDGNFNWISDRVGTFPYRCRYHGTQMIATLQIVP
jgi:plastocyanin